MAYRNYPETDVVARPLGAAPVAAAEAAGFSELEWSVIEIARRDPLTSIEAPGRFAVTLANLLGRRPALPLADPRLEALRRFVVVSHHLRDRLPDREIARFQQAGFSRAHVRTLRGGAIG